MVALSLYLSLMFWFDLGLLEKFGPHATLSLQIYLILGKQVSIEMIFKYILVDEKCFNRIS